MLFVIIALAVLALLFAICYIYRDNLKEKAKNIFKKPQKKEEPKKEEKQPEINNDDFIPLKNQFDDMQRDESLEALLADYASYNDSDVMINDDNEKLFVGDVLENSQPIKKEQELSNNNVFENNQFDFDKFFKNQYKEKQSNKPISQQINELSPELKAILIDSLLKKRDDV